MPFSIILSEDARNAVRQMVRNHPNYDTAAKAAGVEESRGILKSQLMAIVESLGLEAETFAIAAKFPIVRARSSHSGPRQHPVSSVTVAGTVAAPVPAFPAPIETVETVETTETTETTETKPETGTMQESDEYEALAESVLDTIRPVLAPGIVKRVAQALEPLVSAAKKPAVEIERIVTVDESGNAVAPAVVHAKKIGQTTVAKLYGLNGKAVTLQNPVSLWDSADALKPDPLYVPEPSVLAKFCSQIERGNNVWLVGFPGTGKTLMPMEYAARTGRPFVRVAMDRAIEPIDIFGSFGLRNGNTVWVDGKVTAAIRRPGTVILIDEITACPAGIAMTFQTLLDHRFVVLTSGEVVHCAPGVVFIAADNTNGTGDVSGMFHGTNQANAALIDRYATMLQVNYLPKGLETQALANRSGAPIAACEVLVSFVVSARGMTGFEAQPLSLRRMVAFMGMALDHFTPDEAFESCFLNRMAEDERLKLGQHWKAQFGHGAFETAMHNKPVPIRSTAPEQVSAQNAFTAVDDAS